MVLIRFRDDASTEAHQQIYDMYQRIAEECGGSEAGILEWQVEWNLVQPPKRKCDLVEVALFTSIEAIEQFRLHPKHKELTDLLQRVADWWVGDCETD